MTETFTTVRAALDAAAAARDSGDNDRAAGIYRDIVYQFPDKKHAMTAAAAGLRSVGRYKDAIELGERAPETRFSPAVLMEMAQSYMALGLPAQAAQCIQRHIDKDPSQADAWKALGRFLFQADDDFGADYAFGRAVALNPLDTESVLGLGDVMFKQGRNEEGIACYRRAQLAEPNNAVALFKLGSGLMQVQRIEEAEALLRKSLALDPANTAAHVNLATVLHQTGRELEAEQVARAATAANDASWIAFLTLGEVLLELGRIQEAADALQRAEVLSPDRVLTLTPLAMAQAALGQTTEAMRILERILIVEPNNREARHLQAAVMGQPAQGVPEGYAEQLFNWLAPRFDALLAGRLQYRGPQETLALLREIAPDRGAFTDFLDLGCGTGVIGETVGEVYRMDREVGVDVSAKMLAVAKSKGVYDELIHAHAGVYLAANRGAFDLITAIDLFPHVGDLAEIVPLIAGALRPGGLFVYTIETLAEASTDAGYKLTPTGRFTHTLPYIENLARSAGLTPVAAKTATLRQEKGAPVAAIVGAFRRA